MTKLDVIPAPRHRGIFPGEMLLQLLCSVEDQGGIAVRYPSGIYIGLQHEEWLDELADGPRTTDVEYVEHAGTFYPVHSEDTDSLGLIRSGNFGLIHDGLDPLSIYHHDGLSGFSSPITSADVVLQIDSLANLVGADLADELGYHISAMLQGFKPGDETTCLHLRFRRMEDFNEVFLNLCELIAHDKRLPFNRPARLEEFLEFWTDTDGDVDVPAQINWYGKHGPDQPGETQDDYDAEASDFLHLVEAGYLAAAIASILT